jgi:hypothetical protein
MNADTPPTQQPHCDFCDEDGHTDTPCPVRHEAAERYAKLKNPWGEPPDGVEGQAFGAITQAGAGHQHSLGRIGKDLKQRQDFGRRIDPKTGVQKYPTTLEKSTAPLIDRVRHSYEELLDAVNYQTWSILSAYANPADRFVAIRMTEIRRGTIHALLETCETLQALELHAGYES